MHGHMAPQQHPGMHPAHQPPPHLTHLTSLPPHSIQRDHPANRLNNARHHHPRGVDHQAAAGMAPHLPMQVPPPTHQPSHQSQNARKPPGPSYYNMHGGIPKSMPLTTPPHLHPSPPGLGVGPQPPQQPLPPHQQHMGSISHPSSLVGGNHPPGPGGKIPYGMGGGGGGVTGGGVTGAAMVQHQQPSVSVHHSVTMQAPPPIPVVSAATPAGTKTRHIPSNTDHKVHHGHGHSVLQSNGNCGPGSKGIANNHHTNQTGSTMDKSKVSGGPASSGGNRHHHNHHHNPHQQQQHQQQQHQQQQHQPQQQIVSKPNDVPLPKDSVGVIAVTVSAASATPSVASVAPALTIQTDSTVIATAIPANGGTSSMASGMEGQNLLATAQHSPTDSIEALANIKEKTTMCLVNELARYNKIQHQYRLTGESGPAHKKHFTVTLKLGDEEYTAEGASIKKAQHKAAGDAIAATKYKHPPARTNRRTKTGTKGNVSSFTPTVELNALAMKRGEPTVYTVKAVPVPVSKYGPANGTNGGGPVPAAPTGGRRPVEDKSAPGVGHSPGTGYGGAGRYASDGGNGAGAPGNGYWCRATGQPGIAAGVGGRGGMGGFHPGHQQQQQHHGHHARDDQPNRHHAPHNYHHHEGYGHHGSSGPVAPAVQEFYKATLRVGERTFLGEGHTPQAARHDAAARALEVLKPLTADSAEGKGKPGECPANGDTASSDGTGTSADGYDANAELKSPISLVHEIAVQRSLSVVFEVISEKGPPHMTVFVTQCKVGTIVTEGEGTGKKLSKKRAAEKMLEELRKLQSVEQQQTYPPSWGEGSPGAQGGEKRKSNAKSAAAADGATAKKKARNLIKEKSIADVAEKENPISRLMQIQQARKEKQPVYTLMENDRPNVGRRRQFTIEVSASGHQATGVGMTKKAAKWNAAEALLVELGYATESKGPSSAGGDGVANKENQSGAANDSSPPGGKRSRKVRFQDEQRNGVPSATQTLPNATSASGANQGKGETSNDSMNDSIASNDSMGTNSSGVSSASSAAPKADIGAKKEQLLYLAQLLKFEVQFSDFPKGNHGEYLTLVILSTDPNQLCHGSGASLQESHDEAARGALEILSKIGLDNIKPKAPANNAPDDSASSVMGSAATATATPPGTSNTK